MTRQPVPATLNPTLTRRARFRVDRQFQASMEGRAIARPNAANRSIWEYVMKLQWRAGQLPGQTSSRG